MGGVFQLFWGRGGNFQKLGHFLTFLVGLGIVMAPVDVSFSLLVCYNELS